MRARLLVALAAGLTVGAADPAADLGEVRLPVIPPGSRWCWTFEGQTFIDHFQHGGVWITEGSPGPTAHYGEESYTLDPRASPPRIDTTCGWQHRHGIYKVEGDRLLICMGAWNTAARPTTFTSRPAIGHRLYVLKRLPPSPR